MSECYPCTLFSRTLSQTFTRSASPSWTSASSRGSEGIQLQLNMPERNVSGRRRTVVDESRTRQTLRVAGAEILQIIALQEPEGFYSRLGKTRAKWPAVMSARATPAVRSLTTILNDSQLLVPTQ